MISFKEKDFFCFTFSFREAEKSRKKQTNRSKLCKQFDNVRPFATRCADSCTRLMALMANVHITFSVRRSDFHSRFSNIVNGK
jgi:hypothetical protein